MACGASYSHPAFCTFKMSGHGHGHVYVYDHDNPSSAG